MTVTLGGRVVADSMQALTLREASYPAAQYLPLADVDPTVLEASELTTHCPYKGDASYYSLRVGDGWRSRRCGPIRSRMTRSPIKDHVAFYPDRVDAIEVHRDE